MKAVVLVFPGSNCDRDTEHVLSRVAGCETRLLWHKEAELGEADLVVVPGGFSYGDYLRTGAIARFSPVMQAVERFAAEGGRVLGICNGFQILCEAGLLPGTLMTNRDLRFLCKDVHLRVEHAESPFTGACREGEVLRMPVAHHGGSFFARPETLTALEENRQVLLRYCDGQGRVTDEANPNGSLNNIAGIRNAAGNVMGLMPHPERNAESALGNAQGLKLFESLLQAAGEALPV